MTQGAGRTMVPVLGGLEEGGISWVDGAAGPCGRRVGQCVDCPECGADGRCRVVGHSQGNSAGVVRVPVESGESPG